MRKLAIVVGVVILVIVVLVAYAAVNLNRIIARNRDYVLGRISDSIGRKVEVQDVHASLGLGVVLDIKGIKIADDPAFSQQPIVQADEVYGRAEFIPLLFRRLHLSKLIFQNPQMRIVRDARGTLNISELGKKRTSEKLPGFKLAAAHSDDPPSGNLTETAPSKHAGTAELMQRFAINTFSLVNGKVSYQDLAAGGEPVEANAINLDVYHFSVDRAFEVDGKLAALGNEQNLSVSGKVGPLMTDDVIDAGAIPLKLAATVGPILLEHLRRIPQVAARIPARLAISDAVKVEAKLDGTIALLKFSVNTDLSSPRVIYTGVLDKPEGLRLTISASGEREKAGVVLNQTALSLGDLDLKVQHLQVGRGVIQARIDTNRFGIASVTKAIPAASKYGTSGDAEIHTDLRVEMPHLEIVATPGTKPGERRQEMRVAPPHIQGQGTIALSKLAIKPQGGAIPAVANLSGNIRLTGTGMAIDPTTFDLGSGHAKIQADIPSFDPLKGTFQFGADTLKLAELIPSRKVETPEHLQQLSVNGTLAGTMASPELDADVASPSGSISNVDYKNLSLTTTYNDKRVDLRPLKLNAFGGAIAASASTTLNDARPFDAKMNLDNIDIQQVLESQKSKAAGIVRGILTGQVQISGSGTKFDQIKPTLRGSGAAKVRDGKLIGVNVVADALKKTKGIPGVGDLIDPSTIARHPDLFSSPDTDIRNAGLTFTIEGPRITSHDLAIQSPDYSIRGDGSFDLDKNVDLAAQILLAKQLSLELEANKKNVAYLTNQDGEVEIPLRIVGTLPKPKVLPDIQAMAQIAAQQAIKKKAGKFLGGILGGKSNKGAPGGLFPGSGNPLEKLFH